MIKNISRESIKNFGAQERDFVDFKIGDTIAVSLRIKEGNKERKQIFEGIVIAMHKNGASTTFIVRKVADKGVYVERIFPRYSPLIDSIKLVQQGKVRRAKLFYLRDRIGKAARVKKLVTTAKQREQKELAKKEKDSVNNSK